MTLHDGGVKVTIKRDHDTATMLFDITKRYNATVYGGYVNHLCSRRDVNYRDVDIACPDCNVGMLKKALAGITGVSFHIIRFRPNYGIKDILRLTDFSICRGILVGAGTAMVDRFYYDDDDNKTLRLRKRQSIFKTLRRIIKYFFRGYYRFTTQTEEIV